MRIKWAFWLRSQFDERYQYFIPCQQEGWVTGRSEVGGAGAIAGGIQLENTQAQLLAEI